MSVTIHDDMWEAAQQLSQAQGKAYLMALIEYGMAGKEPSGNPAWLPLFTVTKDRIDIGQKKRNQAKKMADARWSKQNVESESSMMPKHDATASDKDDAQASSTSRMQSRVELSRVENKTIKSSSKDSNATAFSDVVPKVVQL